MSVCPLRSFNAMRYIALCRFFRMNTGDQMLGAPPGSCIFMCKAGSAYVAPFYFMMLVYIAYRIDFNGLSDSHVRDSKQCRKLLHV